MQIKFFTVPIMGGELIAEELNVFLRSKKILHLEQRLLQEDGGACWCFCVRYLEEGVGTEKKKVDYREILDTVSFARFSRLREIRKKVAMEEGVPAYAVFTDEELAAMSKIEVLTAAGMRSIKGIGDKKIERYALFFISNQHEADQ